MELKQWLQLQQNEAFGNDNRHYFNQWFFKENGRYPSEEETNKDALMMYYIEFGAKIFSDLHEEDSYAKAIKKKDKEKPLIARVVVIIASAHRRARTIWRCHMERASSHGQRVFSSFRGWL